jgi:hypothetical protein
VEELDNATFEFGIVTLPVGGVTAAEVEDAIDTALLALVVPDEINDLDDVSGTPATGDLLQYDGSGWVPYTPEGITVTPPVAFVIDGGGATITTGIKGDLPPMTYAGNITGTAALSDQSGSIVIQVWKDTMANFPPVVGDLVATITLSANTRVPTSGSYTSITSVPFAVGDVFRFNVASVTSCQRVTACLRIEYEVGP